MFPQAFLYFHKYLDKLVRFVCSGGYVLGGTSYSGIGGDKTQATMGDADNWIVRITTDGTKQWDKDFGGNSFDALYSLAQTTDGGVITGGASNSGISGDKTQVTRGGYDYWIIKLGCDTTNSTISQNKTLKYKINNEARGSAPAFSLYPNPTKGLVHLKYINSKSGKIQLRVFDLLGRELYNRPAWALKGVNLYQLNLAKLSSNSYLVEVNNAGAKKRLTFVFVR